MATLCSSCGYDNPPVMRFCGNCGTRLNEAGRAHNSTRPKDDPERMKAPLIGRDYEFRQLVQGLHSLLEYKQGQFVLITGEAGIGKSRLISELKGVIEPQKATIIEGQSLTVRRLAAYSIFLDALRSYLGVTSDTPFSQVQSLLIQKTNQDLDRRAAEILPYLEHLLSLPPTNKVAAEHIRFLEPGQLRQQIFVAVREFLLGIAEKNPVLLILEDLHWADQLSLDLLLFLIETIRQAPLMILAVSGPVKEETLARVVERAEHNLGKQFCHISLHRLSTEKCQELLFQLTANQDLPASLNGLILQHASGIPFNVEELLRMSIDREILRFEDHGWRIVPGANLDNLVFPGDHEGLISDRLYRLDKAQRRVIQVASVIGREFSFSILHAALPNIDKKQLSEILKVLWERDFICRESGQALINFEFKHPIIAEAIYKTMLLSERSEIHGLIGEAVEKVYSNRLEGQIEILAWHYSWSARHHRALHYLTLAGEKAVRNYDNEQARHHYEQALDLLAQTAHTPDQRIQVYKGLGDVLVLFGKYAAAREHYLTAMQAVESVEPSQFARQKSALHRKVSITQERQGDYEQALVWLEQAQKALDAASQEMPIERAEIINDIGWIHFRRGNLDLAEECLSTALNLVEDTNRLDITASIFNRLGGVYFQKDHLDKASNYVRKSLVIREEIGDAVAVARSSSNLGLLAWRRGDWNLALSYFKRSIDLHSQLGDVEGELNLHANIGLLLTDQGEFEEAARHLQKMLQNALHINHTFLEGMAYHHLSRLYLSKQDWEKSLEFTEHALQVMTEIGTQENTIELYAAMGEAWLGLENLPEAKKAAEKALALMDENGESGEIDLPEKARVSRLRGNICLSQGLLEDAGQLLRESAACFTRLGDQLELGRSLAVLAAWAKAREDFTSYRMYINEARLIFSQLGASQDLEQVEEQLK